MGFAYRPLGITCAAVFLSTTRPQATVWHGKKADGTPAARMSQAEAQQLVRQLKKLVDDGYTLPDLERTRLRLRHPGRRVKRWAGMPEISIRACGHDVPRLLRSRISRSVEQGCRSAADPGGSRRACRDIWRRDFWADGEHAKVLDYVAEDVRIARDIARACEKKRRFQWITGRGKPSSMPLPNGWLTVAEAMNLPEPDTSWMSSPIPRHRFTGWLK